VLGPGPSPNQQTMTAFSIGTGKQRWTASIAAKYPPPHEQNVPSEWPWLVDLNGDGRSDVAVPDSGLMPPKTGFRGVKVLDGSSGQSRWVRPMRPETKAQDGLARIIAAPDLDGDGIRELLAVSRFDGRNPPESRAERRSEPERLYVDALSGRNGDSLWSWHVDLPENKFTWISAPRWQRAARRRSPARVATGACCGRPCSTRRGSRSCPSPGGPTLSRYFLFPPATSTATALPT
jgi:hypothetical protein